MKKGLLLTGIMMLVILFSAAAQQKKVDGTVRDAQGSPVLAATVVVSGTTNGTITDADGHFSLNANPGDTLEVSSIGYEKLAIAVPAGDEPLNIVLQGNANVLNEMVVTALGIKREKRALGYAVQEISGEKLADAREPNLVNDLSGKIAGLQITRSGNGPGGSSKITLRGNNSLTGLNQPLIVVDGIPYDNFTGMSNNDYWNPSLDMGNGLSDLNAEDIATLTVLKGPAAAALYGSRAGNGVILITTKTGKKQQGLGITISSSIGFESIFTRPDMQNSFGQGNLGDYDATSNSSWGPKADGQSVTSWDGRQAPLKTYDNVGNYFGQGIISNQSISFQQKFNSTSIYTSYNRMDDKSITPGAKLTRNNLTARSVSNFGPDDRWTLDTKIQYSKSVAENRPQGGPRGDNTYYAMYLLPRSINITDFRKAVDDEGNMLWYTGGNAWNPYWGAKYNLNTDDRDRFLMYGTLGYRFTDWLSAKIEGGSDMYTTNTENKLYGGSPGKPTGQYSVGKSTFRESNFSTLITAQRDDLFGKLGGSVSVGGNLMARKSAYINGNAGTLVVPDLFSLGNAEGNPGVSYGSSQKKINSVYGTLTLNYDTYLFLTGTFRNDWSSALSKANRSYMYPSISLSYVFTDMIHTMGSQIPSWITFGKLRASYAAAGNDLDPYELYNTFTIGKDPNGNTTAGRNNTLYNADVKSELIRSYEAGLEMRFFDSRLGFDFAVYKSNATNQLINLPMDPLSGYNAMKINAGNIQNKGIELTVDANVLTSPNAFNWSITGNFSTNNNTIRELYGDVTKYGLGGFDNISVLAEVGRKYGEIYGSKFNRVTDDKSPYYGQLILSGDNADGLPQVAGGPTVDLGNQQATALLGLTNSFSYKNFGFSVLVDARFGGKIFSGTLDAMQKVGTAAVTVANGSRDSFVVKGVLSDGSGGYRPNDVKVSAQKYWTAVSATGNLGITEANLYDASNVRVRNIQLSYALPEKLLSRTPFQKAMVSLSCNNVWLISSHMHGMDPESVYATGTNATGFENASAPTTRTFYVNINLGF